MSLENEEEQETLPERLVERPPDVQPPFVNYIPFPNPLFQPPPFPNQFGAIPLPGANPFLPFQNPTFHPEEHPVDQKLQLFFEGFMDRFNFLMTIRLSLEGCNPESERVVKYITAVDSLLDDILEAAEEQDLFVEEVIGEWYSKLSLRDEQHDRCRADFLKHAVQGYPSAPSDFPEQCKALDQLPACILLYKLSTAGDVSHPMVSELWANQRFTSLLGYTVQELQDICMPTSNELAAAIFAAEDHAWFAHCFLSAKALSQPEFKLRAKMKNKDGDVFDVEWMQTVEEELATGSQINTVVVYPVNLSYFEARVSNEKDVFSQSVWI